MSRPTRLELRESYIRAWYQMDSELLLANTAADFIFDDPAEPEAVTRNMLIDYMQRWDSRMRAAGGDNQWLFKHETRHDKDCILTDWEWWGMVGNCRQQSARCSRGAHQRRRGIFRTYYLLRSKYSASPMKRIVTVVEPRASARS